jgi:hypothetical protein
MKYKFPHYFIEDPPCEEAKPEFDYGEFYYVCSECQQAWYFECYPETPTGPIFELKFRYEPSIKPKPNKQY